MLVGEVPIRWWSSTTFLSPKLEPIFEKWALSLSLAFFWKGPRVLPWCNALLRGGGILLTPFILLELEMMVTPYNFYRMIGLSFQGAIIILDGVSRFQLGFNMLGRKYSTETIRYFDLVSDYMLLPQRTMEELVRMARVFLLHLLGAYLFMNGGQLVSLRWLTLFQDFGDARRAN